MKSYRCQDCGTTDEDKFVGRMKGRCYECHKKRYKEYYHEDKSAEPHLCLVCGTTIPHNFFPNSKSKCKKCTYDPKRRTTKQKEARIKRPPPGPKYTCKICGKTGKEHFYKNLPRTCAECYNKKATRYYYPFYDELVKTVGERCGICGRTPQELDFWRLTVDHDHETDLVRGLLCSQCNLTLGKVTKELLAYLQNPPALHLRIKFPEKMK